MGGFLMRDPWSLYFHLAGVAAFLLAHGTSAGMAFALRKEREPERMKRLLELSDRSFNLLYGALLVLLVGGVVGGFRSHYWSFGWIWTSLALLIVTAVAMFVLAGLWYGRLRQALGLHYRVGLKVLPPPTPGTPEEVQAALAHLQPYVMVGIGIVSIGLFLYLMISKPF
jgi:hypothetical protein